MNDNWRKRAACRGQWNSINFFPTRGECAPEAHALCAGCPVRIECLDDAIEHNDTGIWGDTTERERKRIRKRERRSA